MERWRNGNVTYSMNQPSGDCKVAFVANSSVGMRWRNAGYWCDLAWRVGQAVRHWLIPSVWHKVPAASAFPCHLLADMHSLKTPLPRYLSNCRKFSGWGDVEPLAVGASLDWAWVVLSDNSRSGVYECYKDNWLTRCVNWRPNEIVIRFVWIYSERYSNVLTV